MGSTKMRSFIKTVAVSLAAALALSISATAQVGPGPAPGPPVVTGTANQVSVSGAGVVSLPSAIVLPGTLNKITLTGPSTAGTLTWGTDNTTLNTGAGGTLAATAFSTDAANLSGTVASARISGSYTGVTGLGTLTAGATGAGFTVALDSSTITGTLANARTTATSANTASAMVARDGSGNFAAGTITAAISSVNSAGAFITNAAATATIPSMGARRDDLNSGLGGVSGEVDLIAANVSMVKATSTAVTIAGVVAMPSTASDTSALNYACFNGSLQLKYNGSSTCLVSLEELKDITGWMSPISALRETLSLRGFWFSYKQNSGSFDHRVQPGFGAHQVASVDPRLAAWNDKTGELSGVKYEGMTALLASAIQALQWEIYALTAAVMFLVGWNVRLSRRLRRLEI